MLPMVVTMPSMRSEMMTVVIVPSFERVAVEEETVPFYDFQYNVKMTIVTNREKMLHS